jgi:hypothetical protein
MVWHTAPTCGSFTAMATAPPLALVSGGSRGLSGIDAAGYVWSSGDGAEWEKGGRSVRCGH